METMFAAGADFSEMHEQSNPMFVSDVVHKAYIEVNEDGAEAAEESDAASGNLIYFICSVK